MTSHVPIPAPIKHFFSLFPLYRYPANLPPPTPLTTTRGITLLIAPPPQAHLSSPDSRLHPGASHLSADVESLRWQAYIALRGVRGVRVSWATGGEGGVPRLVLPAGSRRPRGIDVDSLNESLETEGLGDDSSEKLGEEEETVGVESVLRYEVLDPVRIPMWADMIQGRSVDVLEGFVDASARDESRAWTVLLEGVVRSVLLLATPPPSFLSSILKPQTPSVSLQTTLSPPPVPLTGLSTPLPLPRTPVRTSSSGLRLEFREAMRALAGRLGGDAWFLGSSEPTGLDALFFASVHCLLHASDEVRREVTQHSNLVAWHRKVKVLVEDELEPLE